ncbi:unnamed protein product, partial [Musa hybrid cultivar]
GCKDPSRLGKHGDGDFGVPEEGGKGAAGPLQAEETGGGRPGSFGFLGKNEMSNGSFPIFGFAIGLLTEYATGASFVQQLKILLSNFGIIDLE